MPVIAHVGEGFVPVIIGIIIIVPACGGVAQAHRLAARRKEHIQAQIAGFFHGHVGAVVWHGPFTAGGAAVPEGGEIIIENKALLGHFIQGRRPFRCNGIFI